jgi:hypothetical protein
MTTDANTAAAKSGATPEQPAQATHSARLRQFPGLAAISLYMLLLAGVICFSVVHRNVPPLYLFFSVFFVAGALGLLMMLRWGWALVVAAVAMMSAFFLWTFSTQHLDSSLVQGLLNLVFFLYLVRSDLREKMR